MPDFLPVSALPENLLTNSDFEDWVGGSLSGGWEKSASSNFYCELASDSAQVKSGSRAAVLRLTTSNYRYLYQPVSVVGGRSYHFEGHVKQIVGRANSLLRIAWYSASSSSQLSTEDSNICGQTNDFCPLSLETSAPVNAALAKLRLYVGPETDSLDNKIIFDTLHFSEIAPPSAPEAVASESKKPVISVEFPVKATIGEDFVVRISLKDFDTDKPYLLKIRGGLIDKSPSGVRTKNEGAYLSDTESWLKFPQATTNSQGVWTGEIMGAVDEEKPIGIYRLSARVKSREKESYFDSATGDTEFIAPIINDEPPGESTLSTAASQAKLQSALGASTQKEIEGVTSTVSAIGDFRNKIVVSGSPPALLVSSDQENSEKRRFGMLNFLLIGLGLFTIISAGVWIYWRNKKYGDDKNDNFSKSVGN